VADDYVPSPFDPVADHVRRYVDTDGEDGAEWEGAQVVILSTTGRRSGRQRLKPLIRVADGDRYIVVASMGGAPEHPKWYLNLQDNPEVTIRDRGDVHEMVARTADAEEKARLWPIAVEQWPDYDGYQEATERDIPLVVCEPR